MLLLLCVVVASCTKDDVVGDSTKERITIGLRASSVDFSPLPTKSSSGNLMAVQIYEVEGAVETPYANGLFSEWTALTFTGYTNTTYKVVATMIVNAETKLQKTAEVYGKPFNTAATPGGFVYSETELSGLSTSTATLAVDGQDYVVPNIDRHFGYSSTMVTADNPTLTTTMKRVSFGVKMKDNENPITVEIDGAPSVSLDADEVMLFSFKDLLAAYNFVPSVEEEAYSETMPIVIKDNNGKVLHDGNLDPKRNQSIVINVKNESSDASLSFTYDSDVFGEGETIYVDDKNATAYITKVLDYVPAPGQFTNKLPKYAEGDTQEDMNAKTLAAIGGSGKGMITLGGYGGYVTVGFDHTIQNVEGKRDFRVLGNAFYAAENPSGFDADGGSCEPGIIMVAYDANKNGKPDADEWYEIAGSSHEDVTQEPWYARAADKGLDVNFYRDYQITYTKPTKEEAGSYDDYISWSDNKDGSGVLPKNSFHSQPYYPQWISDDELVFSGSRLPQNGINEATDGSMYYVLYKSLYGYADNEEDKKVDSSIDISWAVDAQGNSVDLPGVDFIKIYCGVNQVNGWLGECSTEICGIEDLHVLKEDIPTR